MWCYLAVAPILSFSFVPPQFIGPGHPVMCGAYTATIPPGSRLSVYRLLAGVYYAEGRCQREGEREVLVGGGRGKTEKGLGWRKYPDSSLICSTITPSEVLWKGFRAVLISAGCCHVSTPVSSCIFHNP